MLAKVVNDGLTAVAGVFGPFGNEAATEPSLIRLQLDRHTPPNVGRGDSKEPLEHYWKNTIRDPLGPATHLD